LKKDIANPSLIFIAVYLISIFCAIINIKNWGIDMDIRTFLILLIGGLEFVFISVLINNYYNKKFNYNNENTEIKEIKIDLFKIILIYIYSIAVLIILAINVFKIAGHYGTFNNLSQALTLFKQHTSYSIDESLPHYLLLLEKPIIIFAYLFLYFFINNLFSKKRTLKENIKKYWHYLIPVFCYIIQEFLSSNRLTILSLICAATVYSMILYNKKNNWEKEFSVKSIFKLFIILIIVLCLFFVSASFIGRINNNGLVDYITLYAGGSIECLNQFIKNPIESSNIIGKESFYYLIKNLYDYKIIHLNNMYTIHLEFRYYNSTMIGNVYTAYRRWIYDFGYIGMFILQGIMALFFNIYYNRIKYSKMKTKNFSIIIYGFMIYSVFLHPIDGYFYLQTIRIAFITTIILFIIIYYIVKILKIKKRSI
jgi:oligosaccharide repeat unit polymerase